jgi:hypothetical protein
VIVIAGGLIIITFILALIFGLILYQDINKLKNSIKETIQAAKETVSDIKHLFAFSKAMINLFKRKKPESESPDKTG